MTIFRCLILGENFVVPDEEGKRQLLGFYATRFVDATDEQEAELSALAELKADEWLASLKPHRKPDDPPAKVYFEEIVAVEEIDGPEKGFTFFEME